MISHMDGHPCMFFDIMFFAHRGYVYTLHVAKVHVSRYMNIIP